MLEGLLKGLVLWIYGLILEGINAMANALLDVFNMDLSYFEQYAPVTSDIVQIIIATGWALLLGNMAFQAMRSMAAGIGFEGEDPKILFTRTFVFAFLLVASRQICEIGLGITSTVISLMQIPDSVVINTPEESMFGAFDGAWIWMVIVGIILIWQIVKFFFEIGERYVVLAVLTIMAPLAFGMGGSKNTEDIFKGWARMYGSMCVMMLMNVVFLKLLLSAMSTVPSGLGLIPWLIFVVAIARVGRKVDDLVCRVGLNPARTGDPLGRGIPVMVSMMVAKGLGKTLASTFAANKQNPSPPGGKQGAPGGSPRPGPAGPVGSPGGNGGSSGSQRGSQSDTYSPRGTSSQAGQTAAAGAAMSGATVAATGQAAQAATAAAGHGLGQAAGTGQSRQSQGQNTQQESHTRSRTPTGQPIGTPVGQSGAGGQGSCPPRTKPVNIDVEYDEPQAQLSAGTTPPHGTNPNPTSPTPPAKAAEATPSRPPIQRTPRGNFPQAPVGAGATPHTSHNTQQTATSSTSSAHSQTTQQAGTPGRPAAAGGTNVQGAQVSQSVAAQKPNQPPIAGARNTGAGFDRGTQPQGASRPPIGHNATANNISQESRPSSPGRNSTPQSAAPSGGRDTIIHSTATEAQATPPSPGRNGAVAPQKPFPPTQGTDRGTSSAPSPGRNSAAAPQKPLSSSQSIDGSISASPSPSRNGAPAPQIEHLTLDGRGTRGGGAAPAPRDAPTSAAAQPRSERSLGSEEQRRFGRDAKTPRIFGGDGK